MRNYEDDGFSFVPIPVLDPNELLISQSNQEDFEIDEDIEVQVISNFEKSLWNTNVKLEINVLEPDQEVIGGHFNLSVLDADLNPSVGLQNNFEKSFDWLLGEEKAIQYNDAKYPIEYGVSIEGYFSDRPKRPLNVPITVVQGELEDYGIVKSDSSGRFWATGLVFQDSVKISIAALNDRRKSFGEVSIAPFQSP